MPHIRIPKTWELPDREATPEEAYINRRDFLKRAGFTGLGAFGLLSGCYGTSSGTQGPKPTGVRDTIPPPAPPYPADRNPAFTVGRPITDEEIAASYNNFYEFTLDKGKVWQMVDRFETRPWEVEVSGLVHKPRTYDVDDLVRRMPLEERVYRFRCVEAWSMVVPWVGFPFKKLIDEVQPTSRAKYVRMVTFMRPKQAPGQAKQRWYPWPYFEGLRMAEASHELTMLATGTYGHALPKQNGAPIRLITPWKYGFKNIKSIVSIEFVEKQPATFWNTLAPREYDFGGNVRPKVAHPRWTQAQERVVGTNEVIPTLPYNGYEEAVADLYTER